VVNHDRFEPCAKSFVFNFSIVQEIEHFPSNLTVNREIDLIWESTVIPIFPFRDYFEPNALYQFKTDPHDDYRYRTVIINDWIVELKKDLVIKLSLPDPLKSISDRIKEVIFASGDQCIWTYNISSEDRFVVKREVPNGGSLVSASTWNITVPAKTLYHIAFAMLYNGDTVIVDYELVDRPVSPSSAFIPCLDFNLFAVFILSFLIFQK